MANEIARLAVVVTQSVERQRSIAEDARSSAESFLRGYRIAEGPAFNVALDAARSLQRLATDIEINAAVTEALMKRELEG